MRSLLNNNIEELKQKNAELQQKLNQALEMLERRAHELDEAKK